MIKCLKQFRLAALALVFFTSCRKEYSYEGGPPPSGDTMQIPVSPIDTTPKKTYLVLEALSIGLQDLTIDARSGIDTMMSTPPMEDWNGADKQFSGALTAQGSVDLDVICQGTAARVEQQNGSYCAYYPSDAIKALFTESAQPQSAGLSCPT